MKKLIALTAATAAFQVAGVAEATTYDLSSDFSYTANPNGVWSFTQGASALSRQEQPTDGNTLNPAATNGFFGVGPDFTQAPFLIKVSQDGSATPPYNDGDFLAGDVIAHSTNPGAGDPLFINWTAPSAGTISLESAVWYAHSPVTRSNDVTALLDGIVLGTIVVDNAVTRTNAITALSGTNLTVGAGQVLAFRFTPTAGQTFGSLAGISERIDFTPDQAGAVPEPATWAMVMGGMGLVGGAMRRRRGRVCLA